MVESLTEEVGVKSLLRLVFLFNSSGNMFCVTMGAGRGFESTSNRYGRGLGAAGAARAEGGEEDGEEDGTGDHCERSCVLLMMSSMRRCRRQFYSKSHLYSIVYSTLC